MKRGKMSRNKALSIIAYLEASYPGVKSELEHETPFQLLVGTILSAQASDKKVNEVTSEIFNKYGKPEDYLSLSPEDLESMIRQIHFCRAKARHVLSMCRMLVEDFGGRVPDNLEDLMKLPGVGRKTANVVLSYAFGKPAIAVDTHVHRVAHRLGMASGESVRLTELEMEKLIPKPLWSIAHSGMVLHGRRVCSAKNPKCSECGISGYCGYFAGMGPRKELPGRTRPRRSRGKVTSAKPGAGHAAKSKA